MVPPRLTRPPWVRPADRTAANQTAPRARAFTVIEMLVVLAIIALLISLLMPMLAQGRERAKQVKCASNLRQIYLSGVMGYVMDHDGWLPAPRHCEGPNYLYWPRVLKDYCGIAANHGSAGAIDLSEARRTIYICPSDEKTSGAPSSAFWAPTSYGINRANFIDIPGEPDDRPRYKLSQVSSPASSSYFMCHSPIWYSAAFLGDGYWSSFLKPVHNNGVNTLYVDGHVELVPLGLMPIHTGPLSTRDVFWDWTKP